MTDEQSKLVTDNMPLAHFMALKEGGRLDPADALSVAMAALMRAAELFDPATRLDDGSPARFGAFASQRIKWALIAAWKKSRTVRRGGRYAHVSLDTPIGEDGDRTIGDTVMDERQVDAATTLGDTDEHTKVRAMIDKLDARTAMILRRRFGLDGESETLEEIAVTVGLTHERVRQIEAAGLANAGSVRRGRSPTPERREQIRAAFMRYEMDHTIRQRDIAKELGLSLEMVRYYFAKLRRAAGPEHNLRQLRRDPAWAVERYGWTSSAPASP